MLVSLLFLVGFAAFSIFMANRLYVGFSRGQLNVRGRAYTRFATPIAYWLVMLFAGLGLLFGLLMVAAGLSSLAS
jgi:hypothetical protein